MEIAPGILHVHPDLEGTVREYWKSRLWQHTGDTYRGYPICKLPEDLRVYEHIIEATKPEVIVELGTSRGGSAIWFADRLTTMCGGGKVITVDVAWCDIVDDRVTFIQHDLRDCHGFVKGLVGNRRAMVIEDSAHTYEVTTAALDLYSPLVQAGSFFVVEDTIVDTDLTIWNSSGVRPAVDDFLARDKRFVSRDLSFYGVTMHMGGWLEAIG